MANRGKVDKVTAKIIHRLENQQESGVAKATFDLIKALQADQTVFKGDVVAIVTTNGAFAFHGFLLLLNTLYAEQCCKHNVLCL